MTPEEFHRQLFPEVSKKDFNRLKELGQIKEPDYKFAEEYHKEQLLLQDASQQRELLKDYTNWLNDKLRGDNELNELISDYFNSL